MEIKQFRRRVWAMVALLAVILTGLGSTLYDLQINSGASYYTQSQSKIAEKETIESGRGQLLDRNGRVLVSDRAVYQVKLNTSLMGKKEQKAATILALVRAARESGVEWSDTLPISAEAPFSFTEANPYYTIETKEDGTREKVLTRLGRLGVTLKWLKEDPTAKPKEPAAQPEEPPEPGLFERIKAFFTGDSGDASAPAETEKPYVLPNAEELLGAVCASFAIAGENTVDKKEAEAAGREVPALNIGDLSPADARAAAGVLYELELRARDLVRTTYIFAKDVDIDFISQVKELSLDGVVIEATTVRQYHTSYAAHLLGRVGLMTSQSEIDYYTSLDEDGDGVPDYQMDDTVGKEGAELAFESYLRGTPGTRTVERNTNNKIVSSTWLTEPEPGDNVVLTLDLDLQMAVEDILASSLPKLASEQLEGAACVVLDVDTAELLAAASYPTYNLATYSQDIAQLSQDPLHPLVNRAFRGAYPPGSTFKMITAIAGLEEKEDGKPIITPSTKIRDLGAYTYYPGTAPQCWIYRQYGSTHGNINVSKAIEVSCNYFFYDVGRRLGIQTLDDYAARFGLGQKTGLELNESSGVMAGPAYTESVGGTWYEGSTLSVAIGQESTQVTPVQLANYIATLVNGGVRRSVHLLKEVKSSDFSQILYTQEPQVLNTVEMDEKNVAAVKRGMLDLTSGTGSLAGAFRNLGFQVGAKTGSAQVSAETDSNAVFVCFAPYDDPEVVIAMVAEHGGSGSILASMSADILNYYFSAKGTREELLQENVLIR